MILYHNSNEFATETEKVPLFSVEPFILNMKGVDILKKVLIKIYVSPETKTKIKVIAKKKNKSQSKIVRHWVEDYLDTLVFPEDEERGS